jgi:ketosteroid isomerase-like protein
MSQQNVALVQRGAEAWNRGDLDTVLEGAHPNIEITPMIPQLVEGGDSVYRGLSGVRRFWEDWRIAWDFRFGEVDLRDLGETVLLISHVSVTARSTGLDLDTPMAAIFSFEDGRIVRMVSYLDAAHALEAAGLSE